MAKKTILVSDLSGTIINPGEGVKVTLKLDDSSTPFVLDALRVEVEGLIQSAHRKPKRQYNRRAVVDSPQA